MYVSLTREEVDLLNELKSDLIDIKNNVAQIAIAVILGVGRLIFDYFKTYQEYSVVNIRSKGLKTILIERALRFFNLHLQEVTQNRSVRQKRRTIRERISINKKVKLNYKEERISSKKVIKRWGKRVFKVLLFPVYLLLLLVLSMKIKENSKKNVINQYRT